MHGDIHVEEIASMWWSDQLGGGVTSYVVEWPAMYMWHVRVCILVRNSRRYLCLQLISMSTIDLYLYKTVSVCARRSLCLHADIYVYMVISMCTWWHVRVQGRDLCMQGDITRRYLCVQGDLYVYTAISMCWRRDMYVFKAISMCTRRHWCMDVRQCVAQHWC